MAVFLFVQVRGVGVLIGEQGNTGISRLIDLEGCKWDLWTYGKL